MITADEILKASIPFQYVISSKRPRKMLCPACKLRDKTSRGGYCTPCQSERRRMRKARQRAARG